MTDPDTTTATAEREAWRSLVSLVSPTEERNPRSEDLDTLDAPDLVDRILAEDATVAAAVQKVSGDIARLVEVCVAAIDAGGTVHYVGAGTSGRLGVLDAVELVPTYNATSEMVTAHLAGGDAAMMRAVEGAEDDPEAGARLVAEHCKDQDVVIGLAASGRTPFVGGALRAARERGMPTALIAANPAAQLAGDADIAILLDVGPEVVTGSTRMKAATAQKLTLNALSTATMVRLGTTFSNLMINVRPTNHKLVARTVRMLVQATGADPDLAADALQEADGELRTALVALLARPTTGGGSAGVERGPDTLDISAAREAVKRFPADPNRHGDPAGIRSAVASIEGS